MANNVLAGTGRINCYNMLNTTVPFDGFKQLDLGWASVDCRVHRVKTAVLRL
jgi:hypothetical protein